MPLEEPVAGSSEGGLSRSKLFVWDSANAEWVRNPGTLDGTIVQGAAASDAAEAGAPVQIGGSVDNTTPVSAGEGDVRRVRVSSEGNLLVTVTDGNNPAPTVIPADGQNGVRGLSNFAFQHVLAPDSAWDRQKGLGNTGGAGLGVLAAAPWIPGASDVKSIAVVVGATSVNRATVLTPTSGKKVRILSVKLANKSATAPDKVGVYFGTGAAYLTNPTTVIGEYQIGAASGDGQEWPDGGGPIGAANAVISLITETETEVGLDLTVQYREE